MTDKENPIKIYFISDGQDDYLIKAINKMDALNKFWKILNLDNENARIQKGNKRLGYTATALYKKSDYAVTEINKMFDGSDICIL